MAWSGNSRSSRPRKVRGGIKARSEHGEFARHWWARRWLQSMELLVDRLRLQRGQRYARQGQVLSIEEVKDGVVARVQGSRPQPYKVNLRMAHLTDEQWDRVMDELANQAIFVAQLLAGEMPSNIEEAFSAAGVSLFPSHSGDLITHCTCPDWANPCKHVAATHYILGDRFDEDPFMLFRLRGRTQKQILEGLRARRGAAAEEEAGEVESEAPVEKAAPVELPTPLNQQLGRFWEIGPELETFSVRIQPPEIPLPVLLRLGEPDFADRLPLQKLLGDTYNNVSQAALAMAYRGADFEPENND
jgi:uncharacterized Zn finger protein